ncbi:MAG: hypothetical protein O7C75_11565 [Verrucomicrobia bacterium]|nr:hypothetical protein [Verrucomicrobiota bacterium]
MNKIHFRFLYYFLGWIVLTAIIPAITGCGQDADISSQKQLDAPLVTFAVMGDVPYGLTPEEIEKEKSTLRKQIVDLNMDDSIEFVVHVGDIKKGAPPCETQVYKTVAQILRANIHPLFIIPGDNEWNDCKDPVEAWKLWDSHFMRFDQNWPNDLGVLRQETRQENFAIFQNGVLFIGINLVGGKVHDSEEWLSRIEDDRAWIEEQFRNHSNDASSAVIFAHANPGTQVRGNFKYNREEFRPLIEFLDRKTDTIFPKPILLIHGDGHKWIEDQPFPTAGKRITRVQVTQGGLESPLRVEVYGDTANPFRLIRNQYQ